ncbi:hypothetical protein [Desulfobulbus alkaliphilus]|uniref:hypothetical protein n=1 Tax=Desulfobulbus alkaliphilus TaxID=869814 RepID=UPI0019667E9B|nr:hypothetical protein [Desulfobulbus alkaliphilus]MBM9538038.1 hypothetical protein [Desulfobulbus alkaliphilus]
MEKRKYPRIFIQGMQYDVSDGIGCCSGAVRDVSQAGLCLTRIPKRLGTRTTTYTVVASQGEKYFKFKVKPRWEKIGRLSKNIGVEIDEVPRQWTEYILSLEHFLGPERNRGGGNRGFAQLS